jgi:5-methyltetrahydropteroyltriglutamate--homocysteine methyltransferase
MGHLPVDTLLPTTVIGSYALPGWFLVALEAIKDGRFGRLDVREAVDDMIATALRDQETAGLDVVSEGEVRRQDFIMGFYERFRGLAPVEPSRKLGPPLYDTVSRYETIDRVSAPDGLGMVEELEGARRFTDKPLKVAVPGALTLMNAIKLGGPYRERQALAEDLVPIVNGELRKLVAAGCRFVQIDEPSSPYEFSTPRRAVELVNRMVEGVEGATVALHVCFGNLRGRPQDRRTYREWMPVLRDCRVDVVMLEFANREMAEIELWQEHGGDKVLAAGLVDVKSFYVERPDEVAERIRLALRYVAPDKLWVTPDCGFFSTPRWIAQAKLVAMVKGAEIVRRELASGRSGAADAAVTREVAP